MTSNDESGLRFVLGTSQTENLLERVIIVGTIIAVFFALHVTFGKTDAEGVNLFFKISSQVFFTTAFIPLLLYLLSVALQYSHYSALKKFGLFNTLLYDLGITLTITVVTLTAILLAGLKLAVVSNSIALFNVVLWGSLILSCVICIVGIKEYTLKFQEYLKNVKWVTGKEANK